MKTTSHSAFDGQVTWHMQRRTIKHDIIIDAFSRILVDERETWDKESLLNNFFNAAALVISKTSDITFAINPESEMSDELENLRAFWAFAQHSHDYLAIWQQFFNLITQAVLDEWFEAYQHAPDSKLLAPKELTVDSETAKKEGEKDPDFLAEETA